MTGGLGFTKSMQSSLRNNRNLLKNKGDRGYMSSGSGKKATYKEATPEQLQELRQRMELENAKNLKRKIVILVTVVIVVGIGLYFTLV